MESFVSFVSGFSSSGTPPSFAVAAAAWGGVRSQNVIVAMALASRAAAQTDQRRPDVGLLAKAGANRGQEEMASNWETMRPDSMNRCCSARRSTMRRPVTRREASAYICGHKRGHQWRHRLHPSLKLASSFDQE